VSVHEHLEADLSSDVHGVLPLGEASERNLKDHGIRGYSFDSLESGRRGTTVNEEDDDDISLVVGNMVKVFGKDR